MPKISKYSAEENTAEGAKSQTSVSKIPINSNLLFNNDANDDKQTNKHLEKQTNKAPPPKKVCLPHININSIRNILDIVFEFT